MQMGVSSDAPDIHVGAFAHADPPGRRGRQREVGRGPRHAARQRAADLHRRGRASRRPAGRREDRRGRRVRAAARHRGPAGPGHLVQQTAFLTGGSVPDVVGAFNYTVLDGGRIAPEQSWVSSHISTEAVPILGQMTCNRAMFPQLRAALTEIQAEGLADEIHPGEYAGCYYPRFIAGSTDAVQPLLRARLRHQRPRQPAGHRRRDRPGRGRDLRALGLRLGRPLGLHRPDALRDEPDRHPSLRRAAPPLRSQPCAQPRSSAPAVPMASRSGRCRSRRPAPRTC